MIKTNKAKPKPKVLILAGGTGGHITPGVALALEFQAQGCRVSFLSLKKDQNCSDFSKSKGIAFYFYEAPPVPSPTCFIKTIFFPWRLLRAFGQALFLLRKEQFDFIVGMGGYSMIPALAASLFLRCPYYLCEQNAVPGRASRLFYKMAQKIFINFPLKSSFSLGSSPGNPLGNFLGNFIENSLGNSRKKKNRVKRVGNPLRPNLIQNLSTLKSTRKKRSKALQILVLGGSQGALQINTMLLQIIPSLGLRYSWTIQCGIKHLQDTAAKLPPKKYPHVKLIGYTPSIGELYKQADVLICRSGAGVLSEALCFGLPLVLIPYPYSADAHQEANAEYLAQAGAAIILKQKDTDPNRLLSALEELQKNPQKREKMRRAALALALPNAAQDICSCIMKLY